MHVSPINGYHAYPTLMCKRRDSVICIAWCTLNATISCFESSIKLGNTPSQWKVQGFKFHTWNGASYPNFLMKWDVLPSHPIPAPRTKDVPRHANKNIGTMIKYIDLSQYLQWYPIRISRKILVESLMDMLVDAYSSQASFLVTRTYKGPGSLFASLHVLYHMIDSQWKHWKKKKSFLHEP